MSFYTFIRNHGTFISIGAAICIILGLSIAAIYIISSNNSRHSASSDNFPSDIRVGVWSWKSPDTYSQSEMQDQANKLAHNHVSTVYTDISSYADYTEIQDPVERQAKIDKLTASLRQFIDTFKQQRIEVRALAGNSDWGNPDYWHLPEAVLTYVNTYNAGADPSQRLSGMQFDIEYYNDETFKEDKTANLTQYLGLTNTLIAEQVRADSTLPLGFTVPYWLDNENGNAPKIRFKGVQKTTMQHLVDQLNILQDGYITVMSYRNTVTGNDGVLKHAIQEVNYASTKAHAKVYIGLETTDVTPKKITFYQKSKPDIVRAVSQIDKTLTSKPAFAGFTINDSEGFLQL